MRRRLYPRDAESRVSDCSVNFVCNTITFQMITFGVWQWPVRSGPQVSFGDLPTFYANFQRQRGRVQLILQKLGSAVRRHAPYYVRSTMY